MRRASAASLLVAALLMLTACAGIPTSGGIHNGAIIDDELDLEILALPSDPAPGADQQEILTGFLQAARSPQGGYAVARKYLTESAASDWKPDETALIRPNGSSQVFSSPAENVLTYTVSITAIVGQDGTYREESVSAAQTLEFSFAQENEEWRISEAPNGIVLSQRNFDDTFREQPLYFFDPTFSYLVPDVRWFPSRLTLPNRVVDALLAGPSPWLGDGVVTTSFPEATGVEEVVSGAGSTVVDLTTEALAASSLDRARMRQQLVATLSTPNVSMTVRGAELVTPAASSDLALVNPDVDGAALVGTGSAFGLDVGSGASAMEGLSAQLVSAGAVGATLSTERDSVAFLAADSNVYLAATGQQAVLVDDRGGLVVPSIDPFGYVWSAQAASAASLSTFEADGTEHALVPTLPGTARVVSIDVSRDGTRLLLSLQTDIGPVLRVVGIVRQDGVPIRLGDPLDLPLVSTAAGDATWVDDRTVAAITLGSDGTRVTSFQLGGPSTDLGNLPDARTIAGGNNGVNGLRVLRSSGEIWRLQGSGWVSTGILASFLGTKQ